LAGHGASQAADRVFRALDEIYRWLVFCAELPEAQILAGNIRRQFSAAILIEAGQENQMAPIERSFARHGFPILRIV
jgi:hypothetical protein